MSSHFICAHLSLFGTPQPISNYESLRWILHGYQDLSPRGFMLSSKEEEGTIGPSILQIFWTSGIECQETSRWLPCGETMTAGLCVFYNIPPSKVGEKEEACNYIMLVGIYLCPSRNNINFRISRYLILSHLQNFQTVIVFRKTAISWVPLTSTTLKTTSLKLL